MYENFIFEGGSYKHRKLVELVEDLGGYIITKRIFAQEAHITFAAPSEDYDHIKRCVDEIQGMIRKAPLLGTEIAVISPTITRHHLPHPFCDIAEFLRRRGAQTNIIGLARGVGRRTAQINRRERMIIEEHDVAVLGMGNFERCIREKIQAFSDLKIPLVVTGLPKIEIPGCIYIGGCGRMPFKFKKLDEIDILKDIADGVERAIEKRKEEISIDPPPIPPFVVKDEVWKQVEDIKYSLAPAPLVLKINGLRIKLPYDKYHDQVSNVEIAGYRLGEISEIKRSVYRNRILVEMLGESMVS
ncbi:MAG: methanogenesis marker 7 protein [Candidatus Syntropharchaeia archaeon]